MNREETNTSRTRGAYLEIPKNHKELAAWFCENCTANDWYCPSDCAFITKMYTYDYKKLCKAFIASEGDPVVLTKRIRRWKPGKNAGRERKL